MAKPLQELDNPMLSERIPYRSPDNNVIVVKPDPRCGCGCGKTIEVIEFRTHEGEPVASEACYMRISYKEGWLRRVAV